MSEAPQRVKAGDTVGPGTYICVDCGLEYKVTETQQSDLRKCPACACEMYDCFPITHIRDDVKTPEDAKHPPKR
ncbi:hypothetical protein F1737_00300 [Methanoplanus sp. FWC-SCC4]|uniref:Zinc ribbon-containing protein n=1 Tax=Methanochimaera problematica TaxID=2609417 RepID=A0AA97I1J6_9EURY|nr:hypothetical protein [Methanoplanus sp. FWC-SCC4]WOF15225.1 hypothetical protein F1737_00300 [Methanoplanus sp. FWC-SCC4]